MCGLLSLPHRAGAARWPSCSCATSGAWPPKREPHWEEDRERDKSKLSEWRATLCARAPVSYLWKCNYCCCLGSWRCYFVLTVKKPAVPSVVFFCSSSEVFEWSNQRNNFKILILNKVIHWIEGVIWKKSGFLSLILNVRRSHSVSLKWDSNIIFSYK